MRIRFVVERRNLSVTGGPIQRDGFDEGLVGFEPNDARAVSCGAVLELVQESTADAEAARRLGDPHAFELGGFAVVILERAAADWDSTKRCNKKDAKGASQLLVAG